MSPTKTIDVPTLLDLVCEAWTKCLPNPYGDATLSPEDGQTDCNRFVQLVLNRLGYDGMTGLRANQMFDFMTLKKEDWVKITGKEAQEAANLGNLVIAAWRNPDPSKSGHVCIVRPGKMTMSAKWKKAVPMVANVGGPAQCRIDRGVNWAFPVEPTYFLWNHG